MLRARVLARRGALDEALAGGASPSGTAALALRARQLVSTDSRRRVAASIEQLVDMAELAPCPLVTPIPIARREILQLRPSLLGLAAYLRTDRPVYAQGVARLWVLLTDGTSPVYAPRPGRRLHHAIQAAAEALDGNWRGAQQE